MPRPLMEVPSQSMWALPSTQPDLDLRSTMQLSAVRNASMVLPSGRYCSTRMPSPQMKPVSMNMYAFFALSRLFTMPLG